MRQHLVKFLEKEMMHPLPKQGSTKRVLNAKNIQLLLSICCSCCSVCQYVIEHPVVDCLHPPQLLTIIESIQHIQPSGMPSYFVSNYCKYCSHYLNDYSYCSYCSTFMTFIILFLLSLFSLLIL